MFIVFLTLLHNMLCVLLLDCFCFCYSYIFVFKVVLATACFILISSSLRSDLSRQMILHWILPRINDSYILKNKKAFHSHETSCVCVMIKVQSVLQNGQLAFCSKDFNVGVSPLLCFNLCMMITCMELCSVPSCHF